MTKVRFDFVGPTEAWRTARGFVEITPTGVSIPVGLTSIMVQLPSVRRYPHVEDVELLPTSPGWAWNIAVHPYNGSPFGRVVVVPDSEDTIPFRDLVVVDPVTLDPHNSPDPAWWAMTGKTVIGGTVVNGSLVLTRYNGEVFTAGKVVGPEGLRGPIGKTPEFSVIASASDVATAVIDGTVEFPRLLLGLPRGAKGGKGDRGDTGRTPVFTVGAEPSESASVVLSGSADFPRLDFGLPRGLKGDKGDKGDNGDVGTAGAGVSTGAWTNLATGLLAGFTGTIVARSLNGQLVQLRCNITGTFPNNATTKIGVMSTVANPSSLNGRGVCEFTDTGGIGEIVVSTTGEIFFNNRSGAATTKAQANMSYPVG